MSPDQALATYTGYMLWRGLVSERLMPRSTAWPDNEGFGALTAEGYRLIAYPVPGDDGSTLPGHRQISFASYDVGRDDMLRELGCLSASGEVTATLPFSRIPPAVRSSLLAQARAVWPYPWNLAVELAITSETLFATPISEYLPQRLVRGPVAILGDAAHVATPMTGRGFAMVPWMLEHWQRSSRAPGRQLWRPCVGTRPNVYPKSKHSCTHPRA